MAFLAVNGVSKQGVDFPVLQDISFEMDRLENLAIAGETGSGKTSLVQIAGGWGQADAGKVYFNDKRVPGTLEKLLPGHPGIAYLSQYFDLPPHYWVHELLSYTNKMEDIRAQRLYELCRIDHLLQRRSSQLSGGERQRIALARLLNSNPQLLILDEPFSNLDAINKRLIKEVVADVRTEFAISCILVSHDAADILGWAHRLLILQQGRLVQQGSPELLYHQPSSAYVAGLLGEYTLLDPRDSSVQQLIPLRTDSGQWLVRPEQVFLSAEAGHGIAGQVLQQSFRGSHFLTTVRVGEQTILAASRDAALQAGAPVYVSVAADCWLLQ